MTRNQNFNEIYAKYKNLVLKTAYRYSGNYSSADDIMQETFLALYKDMQKKDFDSEEQYKNLKSWLITTAKNKALNLNERTGREVSIFDAEQDLMGDNPEDSLIEEVEKAERAKLHERIMRALLEKNPRWHEAIFLACFLKLDQEEAAKRMGMAKGAFYILLHRARKWIRKEFGVEYEELDKY
ncbi:MAG: RNA polymerase sigma factor [Schaedlerella sp.]|nr:RNA polymerase sigma factor [Schaedlerella sp.]